MKKLYDGFLWLLILSGFPLLAWSAYSIASETYAFWRYGTEKTAHVVKLDHASRAGKAGITYYYVIEIDTHRLVKDFRVRLPEGSDIQVLSLPQDPTKITPGNRQSSAFEIFSYIIGGKVMAILMLVMFCFLAWAGPLALILFIRYGLHVISGRNQKQT